MQADEGRAVRSVVPRRFNLGQHAFRRLKVLGAILIGGYDFFVKPLVCYEKHLKNCLQGRTRACDLPFISLSENVDVVDGVRCRQLLCEDFDAKGRPYERLFYFDAEKEFPAAKEGDLLHIVHHDLAVADVHLA